MAMPSLETKSVRVLSCLETSGAYVSRYKRNYQTIELNSYHALQLGIHVVPLNSTTQ